MPFLTKIDPSRILTSLSGSPRVSIFSRLLVYFWKIESILFSTNIDYKGLQRTADEYAAESRIYYVKSGHVWSFLQAGKIDPSHPLDNSHFCPTTGEKKICLVLFTIIHPSLIRLDRSKWQDIGLVLFCKFLIDHNWIGPLKTQKTELDQYQGHRNLIRMYNNTYIIMLP